MEIGSLILAVDWLWIGYGLAMDWLWIGYGLAMDWLCTAQLRFLVAALVRRYRRRPRGFLAPCDRPGLPGAVRCAPKYFSLR
jgi:hypothetical protein